LEAPVEAPVPTPAAPAPPSGTQWPFQVSQLEARILQELEHHRILTEADLVKITGSRRISGTVRHLIERMHEHGAIRINVSGPNDKGYIYRFR
jgi:hypothetical protein